MLVRLFGFACLLYRAIAQKDFARGVVTLAAGERHDRSGFHYGAVLQPDGTSVPIAFDDAINLRIKHGDVVDLEITPDTSREPVHSIPGFVLGTRPFRISRLRSHHRAHTKAFPGGFVSVLHVRMVYTDSSPSCSEACILDNMYTNARSTQAMYLENSYGFLTFDTSNAVPRVVTVNINRAVGDPCTASPAVTLQAIAAEGNAAVLAAFAIDPATSYDMVNYYTPAFCGIGVAFVGGTQSFINDQAADTLAHELGHNFGSGHASLDPANFPENFEIPFSQSAEVISEYGDSGSVMGIGGFGMRGFNGPERLAFGWIPNSAVLDFEVCGVATSLTLTSLFVTPSSSAISLVRIARNNPSAGVYIISFRSRNGQDTNMNYGNEVSIHSHAGSSQPTLLWKYVAVGETETTNDGLTLTVNSVTGLTAGITITYNPAACPSPSKTPVPPSPTPSLDGVITCGQSKIGSTVGTGNDFDISGFTDGSDTAFLFNAVTLGTYQFSTCSNANFDTLVAIFVAGTAIQKGVNDDDPNCQSRSTLTLTLSPGAYAVVVDGFNGETGSFTLLVTCPTPSGTPSSSPSFGSSPAASNSRTRSASPSVTPSRDGVITCGQSVSGDTRGAGDDFIVPGLAGGADQAYTFIVQSSGRYTFSTCNQSTFDSTLAVFAQDRQTVLGSNDDGTFCTAFSSKLSIDLTPGTFFVVVDGFQGKAGPYTLTVACPLSSTPSVTRSLSNTPTKTSSRTATTSSTTTATASRTASASPSTSATPAPSVDGIAVCNQTIQDTLEGADDIISLDESGGAERAYEFNAPLQGTRGYTFSTCGASAAFPQTLAVMRNNPTTLIAKTLECSLDVSLSTGTYLVVVEDFNSTLIGDQANVSGAFSLTFGCGGQEVPTTNAASQASVWGLLSCLGLFWFILFS